MLILLQWEWFHLPLLQRLQQVLPHLVLIEQAVSRLFSIYICKHCGKGNCEKAAVGSRGDRRQAGGGGGEIWSGGTDYSAMDSPRDRFQGRTVHGVAVLPLVS